LGQSVLHRELDTEDIFQLLWKVTKRSSARFVNSLAADHSAGSKRCWHKFAKVNPSSCFSCIWIYSACL